jgi:spore maturation protein CgeB
MNSLASFQNRHHRETIIVCGCGESLNDLYQPERFITIGVNDVARLFDPTYLVVLNPRHQFKDDRFHYVETSRAQTIFTQLDLGINHPNIVRFKLGKNGGTDLSDPNTLPYTQNSPYVALCLAAHMGAKRIGLIGVDFTDNHFFAKTGRHSLNGRLASIDQEYRGLEKELSKDGIKVFNLSSRSKITAFEKMGIEEFYNIAGNGDSFESQSAHKGSKIFFVNYKFLSCGDVFRTGLNHAAADLGITSAEAYWDDPRLPDKVRQFNPDLIFVVHGRKFAGKWGRRFKNYNTAVWLLDEPYEVDDTSRFSSNFNTVFVNDPKTIHRHQNAHYLPVGFDPQIYHSVNGAKKYDVGFIGGYNSVRQRFLEILLERGLLTYVIGGPWRGKLQRICLSKNIPARQTAEYYQQTKIIVNVFREVHHFNKQKIPAHSLNPRIYEALACGAVVVSEDRPEIKEKFPELPVFKSNQELIIQIQNLLQDNDHYKRILTICQQCFAKHTITERLKSVLACSVPDIISKAKPIPKKSDLSHESNRSVEKTAMPTGWLNKGNIARATSDGLILFDMPHNDKPGSELGLVSKNDYTEVELSFELKLFADTKFLAKIHQQDQYDQETNSYHLFCQPNHTYVAKHFTVFFEAEVRRGTWQEIKLRRLDQKIELFVNGSIVGSIFDIQIQSGFCFLGVKGGKAELRNVHLRDLSNTLDKVAIRDSINHLGRLAISKKSAVGSLSPPEVKPIPFRGLPTRNLIFHIWPVKGTTWQWNLDELKKRLDIFNGRRIIGIVHDDKSESPEAVKKALDGHGCEFIIKPNDSIGESVTFPELIHEIASRDTEVVTFYAHAKGVKYEPQIPRPVRQWSEALYSTTLDDWLSVRSHLERFALTGSFRMRGRFKTHQNLGDWHYSGTFFWMRHAHVFVRDCLHIPQFYGAVEAWPGIYFKENETGCLFMHELRQLPYHEQFWVSIANSALRRWRSNVQMIQPPADLLQPTPLEGHEWPRTEQKPDELNWWIKLLIDHKVRRLLTIGAMHGGVEWHIARIYCEHHRSIEITTVDKTIHSQAEDAFKDAQQRFGQSMRLVQGDSSSNGLKQQLDQQYDAVFIDGNHGYQGVRNDWLLAKSKNAKLIGFHDIVDSDWHIQCRCCVSRLWSEIKPYYKTAEKSSGEWGGVGVVWPE